MVKFFKIVFIIFIMLIGLLLLIAHMSSPIGSAFLVGGIGFLLIGILGIFILPNESRKVRRAKYLEKMNVVEHFIGTHVAGLPIGEVSCDVKVTHDSFIVEGGGSKYTIPVSRLRYVGMKRDTEIERMVTSSLTQGVVGGLLFGTAGAVLGSRVKTKTDLRATLYVIVNYINKDEQMDSICFDVGTFDKNNIAFMERNVNECISNITPLLPNHTNEVEL